MDIKQGKIRNINKKLIAGALVFTLITVPLTRCDGYERFEYATNEQGQYSVNGKIDYDILKKCCFLVIQNSAYDTTEYYIVYRQKHYTRTVVTDISYRNIFNNQPVAYARSLSDNRKILDCNEIEDYLYATNNIKANYAPEEVESILEELKENYLKQNNKELIKEK